MRHNAHPPAPSRLVYESVRNTNRLDPPFFVDIVVNPVRGRPAHFTHDIIAFTVCDIDVDSTGSTDDDPSPSFRAIQSAFYTLDVLQFNAMKM